MIKAAAAACLLLAATAASAQSQGLPAFGSVSFSQLRALKSNLPTPRSAATDVITANHMLVQAGQKGTPLLFGYADNADQYREAFAYWSAALEAAGISVGTPSFVDGMYQIPYATSDGSVLRTFLADPRQFPPKDEAGLRANMALAQSALSRDGLSLVAARVVNVDVILPTYLVLYRTKPDANPDHESQLRVLAPGDDMDFDVFRSAGLDVVQTPTTWMMVYVGPEAGYVSLISQTPDGLQKKLSDRVDFLTQESKKILATRTFSVDDPDYKFGAAVYFLQ
jgi:hypothetical protein